MSLTQPNFFYLVLLFVALLLSGLWVSRLGKPYHTLIFTLHKFICLGLGFWLIRIVYDRNQILVLTNTQILVLALAVLLFIITVAAGGLLSVEADGGLHDLDARILQAFSLVHKFFPVVILVSTVVMLYLFF